MNKNLIPLDPKRDQPRPGYNNDKTKSVDVVQEAREGWITRALDIVKGLRDDNKKDAAK